MPSDYPERIKLTKGLSPKAEIQLGTTDYAENLINLRPGPAGLYPLEELTQATLPSEVVATEVNWPTPQFLELGNTKLFIGSTGVSSTTKVNSAGSISALSPVAAIYPTGASLASGYWLGAGVEDLFFISSGSDYLLGDINNSTLVGRAGVANLVSFALDQEQRLSIAGREGDSDLAEFVSLVRTNSPVGIISYSAAGGGQDLGGTSIVWSAPGGGDFSLPYYSFLVGLKLLEEDTAGTSATTWATTYAKVRSALITQIEQRQVGITVLPEGDDIVAHTIWHGRMIAWGTRHTYLLSYREGGYRVDQIYPQGLHNRASFALGTNELLFLSNRQSLCSISTQGAIKELGYSEYLSELDHSSYPYIVISYDPGEGEFYIANRTWTDGPPAYIYTQGELCATNLHPSYVVRGEGGTLYAAYLTGADTSFEYTSGFLSMQDTGLKHVSNMHLKGAGLASAKLALDTRYSQTGALIAGDLLLGSESGLFAGHKRGTEFQLRAEGTVSSSTRLEAIDVRFSYADGRGVRGPRSTGEAGL